MSGDDVNWAEEGRAGIGEVSPLWGEVVNTTGFGDLGALRLVGC